jgi:hypothetical protein
MGILDEAIREHLELKRRRGATESELKQLEDEAFGPPTRPGEPDFPETGESPELSGNGTAAETTVLESPAAPEAPIAPPAEQAEVAPEPRPDIGAEDELESEQSEDEAPIEALETVEHPFPEEIVEPTPPPDDVPSGEPLPGEDLGAPEDLDAPPGEGAPSREAESEGEERRDEEGEEDVLADTPEFLKDAPEDDELWFEQREPKDFDF